MKLGRLRCGLDIDHDYVTARLSALVHAWQQRDPDMCWCGTGEHVGPMVCCDTCESWMHVHCCFPPTAKPKEVSQWTKGTFECFTCCFLHKDKACAHAWPSEFLPPSSL